VTCRLGGELLSVNGDKGLAVMIYMIFIRDVRLQSIFSDSTQKTTAGNIKQILIVNFQKTIINH